SFSFALSSPGQITFIYDQQSGTSGGSGSLTVQQNQPIGQSFTPTLPSVGFIRLLFHDTNPGNGLGATVVINLRSNSISGPIFGSTEAVFMPDGFGPLLRSSTNLFFYPPVAVTPGTTYYFDVTVQSGDAWNVDLYHYGYMGGMAFVNGA